MTHAELEALMRDLDVRVEKLKVQYDMYFSGFERRNPLQQRRDLDAMAQKLKREPVQATATRFRVQTVVQKYSTYTQQWDRILTQIENGTFKRPKRSGAGPISSSYDGSLNSRIVSKRPDADFEVDALTLAPPPNDEELDDMDTLKPAAQAG